MKITNTLAPQKKNSPSLCKSRIENSCSYAKALLLLFAISLSFSLYANPKREFRGAWIQCVNGQFQGMTTKKMQETLTHQLNELKKDGCNAIIFQVRPECDALYPSKIEPWSRFLSGQQGVPPKQYWDPLKWMIDECHKRGMELHAWINPYRAKTKTTKQLASNHIAILHPERVFSYDGQLILNPAIKENREYIYQVVRDIVERYDIDGLHMDDYFYPYPAAGQTIPDDKFFRMNNNGILDKNDWRRDNVNVFVQEVGKVIHEIKPWVKFGISPFGIYRNKKSDPKNGSNTNGTQNYDDLYADILLWVNNGWIDYCVPQIYWQIGHPAADYKELIHWWNKYSGKRPLYIGEDIERTVKYTDPKNSSRHQMDAKMSLHKQLPNVKGTVLWYAKAAVDNVGNYGTLLRQKYWNHPALHPSMPFLSSKSPKKVKKLKTMFIDNDYVLFWTPVEGKDWETAPTKYVVYAFKKGEKINLNSANNIVAITTDNFLKLNYRDGKSKYTFIVTALNRIDNESKAKKKSIKL